MLSRSHLVSAAILGLLVLPGCSGADRRTTTKVEGVRAVDPSVATLSPDQKLDRALSLPGMKGVLLSGRTVTGGSLVTVEDFTVEKTLGFAPGAAPVYTAGQHVSLVVPGGQVGDHTTTAADAPTVLAGEHLLVFDQTGAGGHAFAELGSAVIVLADRSAVARLNPDGGITWEGLTEPAATFTQHLISHPAGS